MIRLAVCDTNAEAWREVARRLRGVEIDICLKAERDFTPPDRCDAVALIGALRLDANVVDRLLAAKKHVLLSIDSLSSAGDFERWLAAARQAGVQLALANPDRYLPSRRLVRQQVESGKLGEPGLVRIHRWSPAVDECASCGGLPTPLVQDLDVACWLAGKLPDLVYAVERSPAGAKSASRFVQVHLGFPGGGMALIDHCHGLPAGDGYQSLSVIGSSGAAYADDHQNCQLVLQAGGARAVPTGEGVVHLAALVQEFADAARAGRDWSAAPPAWTDVQAVAIAAAQAIETGRAIDTGRAIETGCASPLKPQDSSLKSQAAGEGR